MNGRDTTTLFFFKWNVIVFNLLETFCITEKLCNKDITIITICFAKFLKTEITRINIWILLESKLLIFKMKLFIG